VVARYELDYVGIRACYDNYADMDYCRKGKNIETLEQQIFEIASSGTVRWSSRFASPYVMYNNNNNNNNNNSILNY
jgi:hypothetical protein